MKCTRLRIRGRGCPAESVQMDHLDCGKHSLACSPGRRLALPIPNYKYPPFLPPPSTSTCLPLSELIAQNQLAQVQRLPWTAAEPSTIPSMHHPTAVSPCPCGACRLARLEPLYRVDAQEIKHKLERVGRDSAQSGSRLFLLLRGSGGDGAVFVEDVEAL